MKNKQNFSKYLAVSLLLLLGSNLAAQIDSTIYGVSRNSTGVKFAKINPTTAAVTDISSSYVAAGFALSGSCLNPYDNTFSFFGGTTINTLDIATGTSIASPSITTPPGTLYFQYPYFNNADSTIYGLARGNYFDSTTMTNVGAMYLSTIDPLTGNTTAISTSSIGAGIVINMGYTVDPYLNIYYYADEPRKIKGIDMYTGSIYSNTNILLAPEENLSNIVYNCNDNNIYALVSRSYFDTIIDPDTLIPPMVVFDSASMKLARINITTGAVTIISTGSVGSVYSFNAGITIDPINNIYYYQGPGRLIGISMITGDIVNNSIINNSSAAPYFDLMRHYQNCYYADSRRSNPLLSVGDIADKNNYRLAPNPTNSSLYIESDQGTTELNVRILNMFGQTVQSTTAAANDAIDVSALTSGQYVLVIQQNDGSVARMKFIKN